MPIVILNQAQTYPMAVQPEQLAHSGRSGQNEFD